MNNGNIHTLYYKYKFVFNLTCYIVFSFNFDVFSKTFTSPIDDFRYDS